jgi:hypothetical protein
MDFNLEYEALNYWFNRVDDKYVMFQETIDYINNVLREQVTLTLYSKYNIYLLLWFIN